VPVAAEVDVLLQAAEEGKTSEKDQPGLPAAAQAS